MLLIFGSFVSISIQGKGGRPSLAMKNKQVAGDKSSSCGTTGSAPVAVCSNKRSRESLPESGSVVNETTCPTAAVGGSAGSSATGTGHSSKKKKGSNEAGKPSETNEGKGKRLKGNGE